MAQRKPRYFFAFFLVPYLLVVALFPAWSFAQAMQQTQMQQFNQNYTSHVNRAPMTAHSGTSYTPYSSVQSVPFRSNYASGLTRSSSNYGLHDTPMYHGSSTGMGSNKMSFAQPFCVLAEMIQTHIGAAITLTVIIFGVSCVISRGLAMTQAIFLGIGIGIIYNAGTITEAFGIGNVCPGVH